MMNKRKSYQLEIETNGEVWFTKSAIYTLKEAKYFFEREALDELAENSTVRIIDNSGEVIFTKSN
jgi:hypothetical protein